MNRKIYVFILLLGVTIFLASCVPEEYKEGVKLDRDYPEDELPIMDDAVIFYCDEDDDKIEVEYGIEEDIDDIADFYKDFFEDIGIALEDETDRSSKYSAKGAIENFTFSIKASEPSGKYEEKLFTATVKIKIEFIDETYPAQAQSGSSAQTPSVMQSLPPIQTTAPVQTVSPVSPDEDLTPIQDLTDVTDVIWYAFADIYSDDDLTLYTENETLIFDPNNSLVHNKLDSSVVKGTWDMNGYSLYIHEESNTKSFYAFYSNVNGINFLLLLESSGAGVMYSDISLIHGSVIIDEDNRLLEAIISRKWTSSHFLRDDNSTEKMKEGIIIYHPDGTLEKTYNGEIVYGKWTLSNSVITMSHPGGDYVYPISLVVDPSSDILNLFFEDTVNDGYWVYTAES